MASFCPKCGYKLSMIDIKPECPVCGVNQVYYGMEESLKKEADRAEFEHAAVICNMLKDNYPLVYIAKPI